MEGRKRRWRNEREVDLKERTNEREQQQPGLEVENDGKWGARTGKEERNEKG